jgi:hypothetical protein
MVVLIAAALIAGGSAQAQSQPQGRRLILGTFRSLPARA